MEDINSENYYNILGISKNASDAEIKSSYRKLAMKYHPDKNKETNAEEKFKKINEAYSILSDNKKRTQYDQFGKAGIQNGAHMSNFQANDIFSSFFSGHNPFSDNDNFSSQDPFKMFFRQHNFTQQKEKDIKKQNYHTIRYGTNILIKELISARELNGKHGIIERYIPEKNKYIIKLDDNKKIALEYKNIQQIANITIYGLINKMELNNKKGKIIGFNDIKNKYQISINGNVYYFKPDNIIINNGVCVKLVDIVTQPILNGTTGVILDYDYLNKKYLLQIEGNKKIKVKSINVIV